MVVDKDYGEEEMGYKVSIMQDKFWRTLQKCG